MRSPEVDASSSLALMRLVKRYYVFQFLFSLLFWTPIFFEFQKQMGLSEGEIFRIQSLYYLAFCFLEIPTGFFADRVGYLASLRLGALTLIVSQACALWGADYSGQLTHWILLALARSLVSGASSAYLYEALRERRSSAEYQRIEGRARAWTLYGRVGCFAGVGFLFEMDPRYPYLLTGITAVLALGAAFALPMIEHEKRVAKPGANVSSALSLGGLRDALVRVLQSQRLLFVIFQGVVIFTLGRIVTVNLFQPILTEKGVPARHFGIWMGVLTLAEAWGSMTPGLIRRFGTLNTLTFGLSFLMALSLLPIFWGGTPATLASLLVFSVLCGWSFPIQKQWMNDVIPDPAYRATILSLESIVDRAACAGVALVLERVVTSGGSGVYSRFFLQSSLASLALLSVLFLISWRWISPVRRPWIPF